MARFIYFFGLCYLLLPVCLCAQSTRYASQRLEEIAATLQAEYRIDCRRPQVCPFGRGHIVVAENALHQIDHIGLQLFARQLMEENPSPVYHFVERYLLELCLMKEQTAVARRLKEEKVNLRFGKRRKKTVGEELTELLPRLMKSRNSLMILNSDNRYTVSFYDGDLLLLALRFPIQYELLWGMGKKEVESHFYADLLHYVSTLPTGETAAADSLLPADEAYRLVPHTDGCLSLPGEFYGVEAMNDTRFYRKRADGCYAPLRDPRYPEESVRNLFLLPVASSPKASVTQYLYGRRRLTFELPLDHLLSYCRAMGCRTYVGIERLDEQGVAGTAILQNSTYGYCHLLYFETGASVLSGAISISLYAYVPTHNVAALFPEKLVAPSSSR